MYNYRNNAKYVMRGDDVSNTLIFQDKYLVFNLSWQDTGVIAGKQLYRPSKDTAPGTCGSSCLNEFRMYIVNDNGKLSTVPGINTTTGKNIPPPTNACKFTLDIDGYLTCAEKYVAKDTSSSNLILSSNKTDALNFTFLNIVTTDNGQPTQNSNMVDLVAEMNKAAVIPNHGVAKSKIGLRPYDSGQSLTNDNVFTLNTTDSNPSSIVLSNKLEVQTCTSCRLPAGFQPTPCYSDCPHLPKTQSLSLRPLPIDTLPFMYLIYSSFSIYTPPPPKPSPSPGPPPPSPKPSPGPPPPSPGPSPGHSDPSTLILAIGGGVVGLIIIGLIIYYTVQGGKTKLKASTNKTNRQQLLV